MILKNSMDQPRSSSGNGEDNVGIPDDLRCKRSDGKQWRCTAMSMPDKTVCEKHYIQAKKRAANSALRASLKKAGRKSLGETDIYLKSKSDDPDVPLMNIKSGDCPSVSGKKYMEKVSKTHFRYSPETPSTRVSSAGKANDDSRREVVEFDENLRSYKTQTHSGIDTYRNRSQRSFDASAMTDYSDGSMDLSEDIGGQTCHHCRRNDRERVIWCLKCERRGYCDSCISTWYSNIAMEEIAKICPACRGSCTCKACLRGDNMIKVRIREIHVLDKLQYLCYLLSAVLPVIRQIHQIQCSEVELEKRLRGNEIDLVRAKLNADEQMCCNICRIPIIDYHRHCINCSYDLCLSCCQDLRGPSMNGVKEELVENHSDERCQDRENASGHISTHRLNFSEKFPSWKANNDASIPCPPKEYGGCGYRSLNLNRIFKMNWVAKLVKNVEEMATGCKVNDAEILQKSALDDTRLCLCAHREEGEDNFLYCPSSKDTRIEGIGNFRKHWAKGEPVIIKQVCDRSSMSVWHPKDIWRGIRETADEKMKAEKRTVNAIDCFDCSEVDIELGQFIKGYSEGRIREDGWPEMLKLKDWPSPSASEEFLLYHRPEFISKLPLLEYIHSRLGFLNVAAKLPHYSLQNDVGPKIFMSYGTFEELGTGDSVTNLHFNMRDMVYLLVHMCEMKLQQVESTESSIVECEMNELTRNPRKDMDEEMLPDVAPSGHDKKSEYEATSTPDENEMGDQGIENVALKEKNVSSELLTRGGGDISDKCHPGAYWDVFRRKDVPKLIEYLRKHWKDFGKTENLMNDFVMHPLYDEAVYLNRDNKEKLKDEFGVEPWSFEQHLGEAVFVPAGCPFQVRNLQSTVQLGLDFLSPESMGEAVRLAEEIRCLPNDHEAKLQVLEIGKISLYAASSAIKEVQKLVLDPKFGAELGFEDPNLTTTVSKNLEITKSKQITCL